MIPLRLRNRFEQDDLRAQLQYKAFRPTAFGQPTSDDEDARLRGPGSLLSHGAEWKSMATQAKTKPLSLYRKDRDVNPTPQPLVRTTYDVDQLHAIATQVEKKGNTVTALKSTTPRFQQPQPSTHQGPGAYSPEKFQGAFPILCQRMAIKDIIDQKAVDRHKFETVFAIVPSHRPHLEATKPFASPWRKQHPKRTPFALAWEQEERTLPSFHSAKLQAALTPKNAYSQPAQRQQALAAISTTASKE